MTDETVIGVIPAARIKTGLFSSKAYTLVFTDRRLLLPEMTEQAVRRGDGAELARRRRKGGGRLSPWSAQLKTSVSFGAQYLGADPAAILAETPGNTTLNPGDVRSIGVGAEDAQRGLGGPRAGAPPDHHRDSRRQADLRHGQREAEAGEKRAIAAPAFGPVLR